MEARAREAQAPLIHAEDHVAVRRTAQDLASQTLSVETPDGVWPPLRLPLLGDFQVRNGAIAIAALEWMRTSLGLPVTPEAIRTGLEKTRWPGRCQVVLRDPLFVVDVAHNPDAARALAAFLKKFRGNRPVALICGMLADKDATGFFRLLKPVVDAGLLVPLDSERSMPMDKLLAAARSARLPAAESSISEAVKNARKWAADRGGMVVAAGSFYLVSAVLYELGVEI
jgi:dihydrofolate synthase/folylpolyglutamate synthase